MKDGDTTLSCHPVESVSNGKAREEAVPVPTVVIENTEESTGFAGSVFKVLSMQRFYTKSVRRSRDTWLQKYTYRRANEEREWRRPLMRKSPSPSPSPQPESPASPDQPGTSNIDDAHDSSDEIADFRRPCCMPLVLEPSGDFYFCWLLIVSLGVMYNYWVIILFVSFPSIYTDNTNTCFAIDYAFDSIFLLDILVQFRTGFLHDGIIESHCKILAVHYVRSWGFVLDIISVIPFDLLYLVVGLYPVLRFNRLLKVHRCFMFYDRGDIYSGRPKLFNLLKLIHYLFLIIHWVACLYFILSRYEGFGKDKWIHPKLEGELSTVSMQYLYSLYRSSATMTTVGTITTPNTLPTMIFVIVTYLCGVLIFATIVGNAGDMIVDMRRPRELYLRKLNGMKAYVTAHQLSAHLTRRVIQWFDYLWTHKRDMNEEELFVNLNDNFKAEIAIHVNLETLIKVEMFEDCDPGFLHDLVLKLKPVICSPGDFICRQGEKGHEMYIVNKGCVEVLDEKETILATLTAGSHFGEISLLNMQGIGDRRTASVRSVGFTDLFRLSKDDLEEVLEFYPEEKSHMENIATKTYERQQRERNRELGKIDEDIENEGDPVTDPRQWLAADTATLRRRLSWIDSVNQLRRFTSRIKKTQPRDYQSDKNILQEFSQKAREKRTDDESRRIIQNFVSEIRARDEDQGPSMDLEASPVFGASTECLSSQQLSDKLRRFRNMSKRASQSSPSNEAYTAVMPSDCPDPMQGTFFRPRSYTIGPFPSSNAQNVLDFQTLDSPFSKSLARIASFQMKGDTQPECSGKMCAANEKRQACAVFSNGPKTALKKKEAKHRHTKSFVLPKAEPLESLKFREMVRTKMEKRRKWFEGVEPPSSNQATDCHQINKDSHSDQRSKSKHGYKTVEIPQKREDKEDGETVGEEKIIQQNYTTKKPKVLSSQPNINNMMSQITTMATAPIRKLDKLEEKSTGNDIRMKDTSEAVFNQMGKLGAERPNEREKCNKGETTVTSLHPDAQCACSNKCTEIPQAHRNDGNKKSEVKERKEKAVLEKTSRNGKNKRSREEMEETCC